MDDIKFRQFVKDLGDAYEHIYDLVYLRSHPFIKLPFAGDEVSSKERVWQLHHMLLNAIQELDPGAQAPAFSREWRRHRLLVLRYTDGLTPQAVADQLSISRRHFYREHESALEALAEIVWQRYGASAALAVEPPAESEVTVDLPGTATSRMQLMRLEAAQLVQIEHRTDLAEVLRRVLALLTDKIATHAIIIDSDVTDETPFVWGDHRLIRQLLLGVIGYLTTIAHHSSLIIRTTHEASKLCLTLEIQSESPIRVPADVDSQASFAAFDELAALSAVTLQPIHDEDCVIGFTVTMTLYAGRRTILIADDNEDILELFQRYLQAHDYEVLTVNTSRELLDAAKRVQPSAIILDLMMPDQDGWDLLQILQHQPETQSIPIIICSVLRQKELALSLGATAFLEKPISEEELASVLAALV